MAPSIYEIEQEGRLTVMRYKPCSAVDDERQCHPHQMEDAVPHGQVVTRVLLALKSNGIRLNGILTHRSWGGWFNAEDVCAYARLINFSKFHHNASTAGNGAYPSRQRVDIGSDPEFPVQKAKNWGDKTLQEECSPFDATPPHLRCKQRRLRRSKTLANPAKPDFKRGRIQGGLIVF